MWSVMASAGWASAGGEMRIFASLMRFNTRELKVRDFASTKELFQFVSWSTEKRTLSSSGMPIVAKGHSMRVGEIEKLGSVCYSSSMVVSCQSLSN